MTKEEMKETLKEVQKKVLLSYDEEKIKEFLKILKKPIPENPTVFWIGIHKWICNLPDFTDEEKKFSRRLLKEYNFSESITETGKPFNARDYLL
jgi:hypothetical protein